MTKYYVNCLNKIIVLFLVLCFLLILAIIFPKNVRAFEQVSVGMTYYGGHYDEKKHHWVVDNTYQCDRIKSGEFSAGSLGAVPSDDCDDDPGYGYFDYIPLHNTMSYAELSINPSQRDFSALGNLPARTRLQVEYAGKCVVLEKLDVGGGGTSVRGYQRSIDLWWETARSLGFTNGFDVATVSYIDQSVPLTPLGQTSDCIVKLVVASDTETPGLPQEITEVEVDIEDAASSHKEVLSSSNLAGSSTGSAKPDNNSLVITSLVAMVIGIIIVVLHMRRPRLSLKKKKVKVST